LNEYGGAPEHLAEWLDPYVDAGVRHVVLRVADEDDDRGLETPPQRSGCGPLPGRAESTLDEGLSFPYGVVPDASYGSQTVH